MTSRTAGAAAEDEWLWYGGRVCLDYVNTLRDRWKEPRETLREPDDVLRWLHVAGVTGEPIRTPAQPEVMLDFARRLREAIDRAVMAAAGGGLPDAGDLSLINDAAMVVPRPAPQVVIVGGRLAPGNRKDGAEDAAAGLGLVAHDAVELLLSDEIRRVRVCGADRCALRFVDRSPAHNRRWCSMARCGNRTKVRSHQLRHGG
ncbi:CGNR zinc finger domain-containing protein [Nonomuraea sp. GTA35]|uniref:CGNR zinc finger domain-containing protein n=1 Tax=Nonomuraea sp. GTA35 TaxID=1676746 RepID=UPI0035C1DB72